MKKEEEREQKQIKREGERDTQYLIGDGYLNGASCIGGGLVAAALVCTKLMAARQTAARVGRLWRRVGEDGQISHICLLRCGLVCHVVGVLVSARSFRPS